MVEPHRQNATEQVKELRIESARHPKRRITTLDDVLDRLGYVFRLVEGERHEPCDELVHIRVVRVVGIAWIPEGALRLSREASFQEAVGVDEPGAHQGNSNSERAHFIPK